jgi:hypothetical protein
MNLFAQKPDLPELIAPTKWECPITGIVVPKVPYANLKWRADLLAAAETDRDLQVDLFTASSQSILFWINAFAFTLRIFEPSNTGESQQAEHNHLPFVTWNIQDDHLLRIEHGIDEGESLLTDKSRDMGATWNHIAVLTHRLLFRESESHLMISRKEDAVDILDGTPKGYPHGPLSNPGTLFGKVDYVLSRLPEWMLPKLARKKLHLVNLDTGSRIDGESANATAGSSDRRTSIFLDEFAKIEEAESIKRSTKDVTACRFPCSTPNGPGTAFSIWRTSGQIPVFAMPWWEHPEKGKGRYAVEDKLGRWKIRSPWYDAEDKQRSSKEMAIELDMDHIGSGDTFFETTTIEEHKKKHAKHERTRLSIEWKKSVTDSGLIDAMRHKDQKKIRVMHNTGSWRLWCALNTEGRPDQMKSYTFGVDISKGQGASNSVVSVLCNETREKVAEFADANTPPHEFARMVCAAALWVGGRNGFPLVVWENNGDPGHDFGKQFVHVCRYPRIYFDRATGTLRERVGKRYGWRSNPEKKAITLGELRRAYAHETFINRSKEALDEALSYIAYPGGGIGPAELVVESDSTRKAHGDRVIADMLSLVGLREAPRYRDGGRIAPQASFAHRLAAFKTRKQQAKRSNRFDFSRN